MKPTKEQTRIYDARFKQKRWHWFVNEVKGKLFCRICGESRFWCLDFHHKDPTEKEDRISNMLFHRSKKKILEEIEKCDVLCRNCHADEHYKLNQLSQWRFQSFNLPPPKSGGTF